MTSTVNSSGSSSGIFGFGFVVDICFLLCGEAINILDLGSQGFSQIIGPMVDPSRKLVTSCVISAGLPQPLQFS